MIGFITIRLAQSPTILGQVEGQILNLRAFGARVLVKRSWPRPTKGGPHYYDGRFLRSTATDRNIVYYDEVTHRDKTARDCTIDEFYYGSVHRPLVPIRSRNQLTLPYLVTTLLTRQLMRYTCCLL